MRAAAGHDDPEGQRSRLRAHDVEPGRLGDERGVEGGVALECRERPQAAVLLGGDALEHDLRQWVRRRGERVQGRDDGALHVDRPAAVQAAVLDDAGRPAPRHGAEPDDVDVPVERDPARRRAGARDGQAPEVVARCLLTRMVRVGAQGGEVVLVQVGRQPEARGELGERLQRGALVPRGAGDAHERRRIADERCRVDFDVHSGFLHNWPFGE